jgi:hypothetical protein
MENGSTLQKQKAKSRSLPRRIVPSDPNEGLNAQRRVESKERNISKLKKLS